MKKQHIAILLGIIILDQLSKWWVSMTLQLHESISIIPHFLSITYTKNKGAAWSILEGKMIFFYAVTLLFIGFCFYFYRKTKKTDFLGKIAIILMLSGALGNFIDRLYFQYVRDFIQVFIFNYDFPVFNIADSSLCIGVALLLISTFIEEHKGGTV